MKEKKSLFQVQVVRLPITCIPEYNLPALSFKSTYRSRAAMEGYLPGN